MNETFQKWTSTKKNYIATAEAHKKLFLMTKKESSKKGWTIMDKFKENNHPTCK